MTHKIAVGSTGALSGKSTLAKHLEKEYGFIRADHSLTLVEDFVRYYNAIFPHQTGIKTHITVEDVYADKEKYRQQLQMHGYNIGFNDSRAKFWIQQTLSAWSKDQSRNVVFDSFRGEGQAQVMREMGFTLVQLEIDESVRRARAAEKGVDYEAILGAMEAHPELEMGIDRPDIRLDGSVPVEVLANQLLLRRIAGGRRHVYKFE